MHPPGTKPLLPSLALAIKDQDHRRVNHLPEVGRKPRVGKMEKARVPRRFFVQMNALEFQAVIIPEAITPLLVEKFHLKPFKNNRAKNGETQPKVCIPLRTTKCCEYMVQLRWFDGRLVLFKGWEDFVRDMDLSGNDVIHFKYDGHDFKVKLFRFIDSIQHIFYCADHES